MKDLTLVDEITQETFSYSLPGKWDELTQKQLLFLIRLVNKNVSAEEIKVKMFLYCVKGRVKKRNEDLGYRIKIGKEYFDFSVEELHTISDIFSYLFTEKENQIQINPLLVVNPFPVIRVGCIKLYGPSDGLTDYTYQQFMELQIAQSHAGTSQKEINKFLSMMYRRKNGKQSFLFRFISVRKKIAILWFYLGCLNFFQEKWPLPFSGESGSDIVDGQMRIIDALAKNDVTKKKLVRDSDLYEVFYTMQIAAEEAEKIKEKK